MREDLSSKSLPELKAIAKEMKLKGVSTLKKAELLERIMQESSADEEKPAEAKTVKKKAAPESAANDEVTESAPAANVSEEEAPSETETLTPEEALEKRHRERRERINKARAERGERPARRSRESGDRTERGARTSNRDRGERTDRNERSERGPRSERRERPERIDRRNEKYYDRTPEKTAEAAADQVEKVVEKKEPDKAVVESGEPVRGILDITMEGFGFIRNENFLSDGNDVYVSPSQIRRFGMRTGDVIEGIKKIKSEKEKFAALLLVNTINGKDAELAYGRPHFEDLTPIFPDKRLHLETPGCPLSMRVVDLMSPIGKGQRGMIVAPPKAGKTTLLKQMANSIQENYPEMNMIVLLIDERPEEVTDFKESVKGEKVEVIYSTFDELPEHHKRVAEMVLERAKRLVEQGDDVIILLDSITRLSRAYNLIVTPSGRTLSGGLDPAALYMPKKFFGSARNLREGGSLTILATALVETGSRLDEMVFEEFKGTGNMELVLDRKLSERRIFPAVDILKSGTRRDDLLLSADEQQAMDKIGKVTKGMRPENQFEQTMDFFLRTKDNEEMFAMLKTIVLR